MKYLYDLLKILTQLGASVFRIPEYLNFTARDLMHTECNIKMIYFKCIGQIRLVLILGK
jgi:hypothetical protein